MQRVRVYITQPFACSYICMNQCVFFFSGIKSNSHATHVYVPSLCTVGVKAAYRSRFQYLCCCLSQRHSHEWTLHTRALEQSSTAVISCLSAARACMADALPHTSTRVNNSVKDNRVHALQHYACHHECKRHSNRNVLIDRRVFVTGAHVGVV